MPERLRATSFRDEDRNKTRRIMKESALEAAFPFRFPSVHGALVSRANDVARPTQIIDFIGTRDKFNADSLRDYI